MVVEGIGQFFADFAVTGIGGVDPKIGFSDQNIDEPTIAKAIIATSNECIVLADSSKFNRQGVAHVADFHQVDYLVSSEQPDNVITAKLTGGGVVLKTPKETMSGET